MRPRAGWLIQIPLVLLGCAAVWTWLVDGGPAWAGVLGVFLVLRYSAQIAFPETVRAFERKGGEGDFEVVLEPGDRADIQSVKIMREYVDDGDDRWRRTRQPWEGDMVIAEHLSAEGADELVERLGARGTAASARRSG